MTDTALSGGFGRRKPSRVTARESGVCLYGERMSDSATASLESGGMSGDDAQSDRERRAGREAFEFSIPVAGKVRIENTGHDDGDEHEYVVAVEDDDVIWCTCPDHEFRNERCKHMIAVENQPAIMQAASANADEIERAREGEDEDEDEQESGTGDDPEVGDERVTEYGIAEVFVGEPDCSTAAASGWIMDRDRMERVDQTDQTERAHNLGVEDVAFGGGREA